jgi:hypothetical protein
MTGVQHTNVRFIRLKPHPEVVSEVPKTVRKKPSSTRAHPLMDAEPFGDIDRGKVSVYRI